MSASPSAQLVLLPGVGGDTRQFAPQRAEFPDLVVPPWIAPTRHETLDSYAVRFAQQLALHGPVVLGGSSFGGMVAYEMARHIHPKAVVLIGSCRSRRAILPSLHVVRPIARWIPSRIFDLGKPISPFIVGRLSRLPSDERRLCAGMLKDDDSRFMHWACNAILRWHPQSSPQTRVLHIHGRRDHIIPAKRVDADEIVPDGGHLINLTHPRLVNAFLRRVLKDVS